MSYKFPPSVSFGRIRRYATQVIGGLEARPATAPLAASFRSLRDEIVAARAQREQADDAVLVATARLRVEDVDWDDALGKVSARAFELADKDASQDPYAALFGKIAAKRAKGFGVAKAIAVGETVARDGARLGVAELAPAIAGLEAATTRLTDSKQRFDEADDALFEPRRAKKKLIGRLNDLIAITEAGVLTAFPGRDDIVTAVLTPWFERRKGKQDDEAPVTPDLEDDDEPELGA